VSFDPPEENAAWAAQEGFQYELWTDEGRELALYYGAASSPTQGSAGRITQLLGPDGAVALEYPLVSVGTHPGQVLSDCQALFGP
jgi:peroxiredoxin